MGDCGHQWRLEPRFPAGIRFPPQLTSPSAGLLSALRLDFYSALGELSPAYCPSGLSQGPTEAADFGTFLRLFEQNMADLGRTKLNLFLIPAQSSSRPLAVGGLTVAPLCRTSTSFGRVYGFASSVPSPSVSSRDQICACPCLPRDGAHRRGGPGPAPHVVFAGSAPCKPACTPRAFHGPGGHIPDFGMAPTKVSVTNGRWSSPATWSGHGTRRQRHRAGQARRHLRHR